MPSFQTDRIRSRTSETSLVWMAAEGISDAQLLNRFVQHRDETAFEALVQRHGRMVWGVCRRQLSDTHAADDAFQATFLVLVRKAASISQPDLLGNWLYGVAYRVAVKARVNLARRVAHERQAAAAPRTEPDPNLDNRELRKILDEELEKLPEKYRTPLVLCYLEGKTNEEAAKILGCPLGSMSWRLSRGRDILQRRLRARNLTVPAALGVILLTESTVSAAVPLALAENTIRTGLIASGIDVVGSVPAAVAELASTTMESMTGATVKIVVAFITALIVLLALSGVTAAALAWWTQRPPSLAAPCLPPQNLQAPKH